MWSRDINKAKSVAFRNAQKMNKEVKRLTISQVLSIAISGYDVEGDNFYIDCTQKPFGDTDKVKGVLSSFIEDLMLKGCRVVVYVGFPNFCIGVR